MALSLLKIIASVSCAGCSLLARSILDVGPLLIDIILIYKCNDNRKRKEKSRRSNPESGVLAASRAKRLRFRLVYGAIRSSPLGAAERGRRAARKSPVSFAPASASASAGHCVSRERREARSGDNRWCCGRWCCGCGRGGRRRARARARRGSRGRAVLMPGCMSCPAAKRVLVGRSTMRRHLITLK